MLGQCFTAEEDRPGLLSRASGGTLYLDGIDAVSPALQAKLLRVLEDGEVRPVGGQETNRVVFRLVGSSRLPEPELRERLRDDFYWRGSGFTLAVPPLRERKEDVRETARELLRRWSVRTGRPVPRLAPEAIQLLERHAWPGNVRELANVLERALVADSKEVVPGHLLLGEEESERVLPLVPGSTLRQAREETEGRYLRSILRLHRGQIVKSARSAGVSRRHLLTLLKRHGIDPQAFK